MRKLILFLLMGIFLASFVSAIDWENPNYYIKLTSESNLNVNGSDFWDNYDTITDIGSDLDDAHLHNALNITNEYWVNESGDTMSGNLAMGGNNISNIDTLFGDASHGLSIGDAGVEGHCTSNDDLFVSGKLEVDGTLYTDGALTAASGGYMTGTFYYYTNLNFRDNSFFTFGSGNDAILSWRPSYDYLSLGLKANRTFLLLDYSAYNDNYGHPGIQPNPTFFIHSTTRSSVETDEWISFTHNTTDGLIDVGSGNIELLDNTVISGTLDSGAITSSGSITGTGGVFSADTTIGGGFGSTGITLQDDGDIWMDGNLYLGGNITKVTIYETYVNGSWLPTLTDTYDLGSSTLEWNRGFFGTNLTVDTDVLHINGDNDKVGIGTVSPSHELNVVGDVNITGSLYVETGDSLNQAVCWKAGGLLGYCTTAVNSTGGCTCT